ncbi:MAG: hypothetical protein OEV08_03155 [Nitrospira sp.]|nr:hypothetical protein [Nitrospira sp.]
MRKFLAALALIGLSFSLGFYFGQRPVGTLQRTVSDLQRSITDMSHTISSSTKDMSKNIYDTTRVIEWDLRRRQALISSKSLVVQAKAELLEKNYGEAATQVGTAAETLEQAIKKAKQEEPVIALQSLVQILRDIKLELAMGRPVTLKKIDDLQREIDRQLNQ